MGVGAELDGRARQRDRKLCGEEVPGATAHTVGAEQVTRHFREARSGPEWGRGGVA